MSYSLQDNEQGGFDLVQIAPTVVGTFADHALAMKVLELLAFEGTEERGSVAPMFSTSQTGEVNIVPEPMAPVCEDAKIDPEETAPKKTKERTTAIAKILPSQSTEVMPTTDIEFDLDAVFERVRNGEKIALIAADIGVPMGSFRAKWANHNRYLKATTKRDEQVNCVLCAKEFTPSSISPDKCARCARD